MSWVEVEMSWVEVDGAGWSWVHGLVTPIFFPYRNDDERNLPSNRTRVYYILF